VCKARAPPAARLQLTRRSPPTRWHPPGATRGDEGRGRAHRRPGPAHLCRYEPARPRTNAHPAVLPYSSRTAITTPADANTCRYLEPNGGVLAVAAVGVLCAFSYVVNALPGQCLRHRPHARYLVAAVFGTERLGRGRCAVTSQRRRRPGQARRRQGGLQITGCPIGPDRRRCRAGSCYGRRLVRHRVHQLTGAAEAEAADAGARSSGAGTGTPAPPWSSRNGG